MKILFLISWLVTSSTFSTEVETLSIKTPRGDSLEVRLHRPVVIKDDTPILIIGPGQGYHMELPLVKGLAKRASDEGFIAFRFNWHYFTNQGSPSLDLSKEIQDMGSVLGYAVSKFSNGKRKFLLAGKSLGTLVSYSVFNSNRKVNSLYLLTPICSSSLDNQGNQTPPKPSAESNYPNLIKESRPIHMTLGNRDPHCHINILNGVLKDSQGNISTTIFGGDHGMNIGKWNDPDFKERNEKNIQMAIDSTVHWMKVHLGL